MRNLVGYENKVLANTGYNYVTPMFIQVDGTESTKIQDIQMEDYFYDGAAEIQVLDKFGLMESTYNWYQKSEDDGKAGPDPDLELCDRVTVPAGKNGLWFYVEYDEESGEMVTAEYQDDVEFDYGDSIQLYGRKNYYTSLSGQVSDGILAIPLKNTGYNYVGNPFPADIDIQDVQMDDYFYDGAAEIQMLDKFGIMELTYNWYQKSEEDGKAGPDPDLELCDRVLVPEGKNGLWFYVEYDEESGEMVTAELAEDVTVGAGDGFQLYGRKNYYAYITCPYEL